MHKCKVTTRSRVCFRDQEYQQIQHQLQNELFINGCKKSQEALMDTYQEEVRIYADTFSLPMKRNIFGLLVIPVRINHVCFQFILDTGAQISGIRMQSAKKAQLPMSQGKLEVGSIGGAKKYLQGCIASSFVLGAREYYHKPLVVLDEEQFALRFGKVDLLKFDGIVGWDILSQLDFEIDDVAHTFKVLKNRFKFPCRNLIAGSFPTFLVKNAAGQTRIFGFDSGSKHSWLGNAFITSEHLKIVADAKATGFGVHGKEALQLQIVKQYQLQLDRGEIVLHDIMNGPCDFFPHFSYDGVLGNEICKNRRIRIVNSKNVVLLV